MYNNLKKLNKVRKVAQTIENPLFKRQYENIINPILEKYQQNICTDDEMYNKINKAIKEIKQISKSCTYTPNKGYADFTEHEKLYQVELLCNELTQ